MKTSDSSRKDMKILLTTLNAKYIHSNPAIRSLWASVERDGHIPDIVEFTINHSDDYIFGEILRGNYDLVCFSCYIWNIERTLYLIENLKKASPDTVFMLGGPEAGQRGVSLMKKHPAIDYVLKGEGEENFRDFLNKYGDYQAYENIKGLHFRQEGKIYVSPEPEFVDFASLPFPYEKLVCEDDKIIYYESVRGCPYSCAYCLSSIERGMRALPLDRVKKDLSYFIYKQVKQVKFIDRSFNYSDQRARDIMAYLIERDNGVTNFHFEMLGDLISPDMLKLLAKARDGLFQFEIGVQSINPETNKAINRRSDFPLLAQRVTEVLELGNIHLHLDLIAGLPFEDYDSFRKSFNHVYDIKPHMVQLGFLKLLHGTPLDLEKDKHGYIYRRQAPYEVISNNYISAKELVRLKMVERVLNLYYNRGGYEKTLTWFTEEVFADAFKFYENFSKYYYKKGFQHRSHNKEDLYRILYSYGVEIGKEKEIEELLDQDMDLGLNPEAVRKFKKTGWKLKYVK